VNKSQVRTALLGAPGAAIMVGGFAAIWETPRVWLGERFAALLVAMTTPLLTMALTILVVIYLALLAWTYLDFRPAPLNPEQTRENERVTEQRQRRRMIIDNARAMVAKYEAQSDVGWREMLRSSPEYTAVRPYLSEQYMKRLNAVRTLEIGMGGMHPPLVAGFLKELDRLESEWDIA
jgi:hypothetical protein